MMIWWCRKHDNDVLRLENTPKQKHFAAWECYYDLTQSSLLSLSGISETTQDAESPVSGAVRYIFGHHGSILSPNPRAEAPDGLMTSAATSEMQSQVVNFFSSNGHVISVQNDSVVQ